MRLETETLEFVRSRFGTDGIVTSIQVGGNGQAGECGGGTYKVQNLLIAIQRFAGPVF